MLSDIDEAVTTCYEIHGGRVFLVLLKHEFLGKSKLGLQTRNDCLQEVLLILLLDSRGGQLADFLDLHAFSSEGVTNLSKCSHIEAIRLLHFEIYKVAVAHNFGDNGVRFHHFRVNSIVDLKLKTWCDLLQEIREFILLILGILSLIEKHSNFILNLVRQLNAVHDRIRLIQQLLNLLVFI